MMAVGFPVRALLLLCAALASAGALGEPGTAVADRHFRMFCLGCHQASGAGVPEHGIPDFTVELDRMLRTDGGRAYLSQVPGVLNTPLTDAQTADLLNWVVRRFTRRPLPDGFADYTAAEVAQFRRTAPADIKAVRAKLLAKLQPTESDPAHGGSP